jgi:hypothetical protein
MSQVNGRAVKAALMHNNIFFPGIGEIKKELNTADTQTQKGIKMTVSEPFVVLEIKDKVNTIKEVAVPLTNFSYLVLAPE